MIEESITAALAPLFGGRVFPDEAPFNTQRPYAFYTQVGGQEPSFIDKTPSGIRNARMQINVWANTRKEATVLARQVSAALIAAADMEARPEGAFQNTGDSALGIFGTVQDFDCWKNE